MKSKWIAAAIAGFVLAPCMLLAQAPPAGATGKCKDGTFTTAPTKSGACRGHKGVDTWFAAGSSSSGAAAKPSASSKSSASKASAPAPAAPAASAPAAAAPAAASSSASSSSSSSKSTSPKAARTAAAGGGPGLVWLNTKTNVFHCYGAADYGTTKAGKYLSEADAKAAGGRPAGGKACSK